MPIKISKQHEIFFKMTREATQESQPEIKEHKSAVTDVFNTMLETINRNACKEVINEGGVLNDYSHYYDNLIENEPSDGKAKPSKNVVTDRPLP
ncbi:hypothetical protein, partial [Corallococcus exiguus]|uniref:hypothetical protein n=1 Tax=Corallococcus exiguus TaxID=83462 RepID=UPI0015603C4C